MTDREQYNNWCKENRDILVRTWDEINAGRDLEKKSDLYSDEFEEYSLVMFRLSQEERDKR